MYIQTYKLYILANNGWWTGRSTLRGLRLSVAERKKKRKTPTVNNLYIISLDLNGVSKVVEKKIYFFPSANTTIFDLFALKALQIHITNKNKTFSYFFFYFTFRKKRIILSHGIIILRNAILYILIEKKKKITLVYTKIVIFRNLIKNRYNILFV